MNGEMIIVEHHPIKFGRWLLKNTSSEFDDDGFLYWSYNNIMYDTDELYHEFCRLQK